MADGASDEQEPSDKVYGTVDAPARFKPDVRKRLGFSVKTSEKVATRQKTICRHCSTRTTPTTHVVMSNMHFFPSLFLLLKLKKKLR